MIGGHSSGSLSSQFIKLASGDTFVDTSTDLPRHQEWVTVVNAKAIGSFFSLAVILSKWTVSCLPSLFTTYIFASFKTLIRQVFRYSRNEGPEI